MTDFNNKQEKKKYLKNPKKEINLDSNKTTTKTMGLVMFFFIPSAISYEKKNSKQKKGNPAEEFHVFT